MLSHLPCSLNLTFYNIFRDDVSMDSFVMSFRGEQDKPSLFTTRTYVVEIGNSVLIQEIVLQPVAI